jgi:hypothetical protein
MKQFVNYKNSAAWDVCSESHKKQLLVPNVFLHTLLFHQTREGFDLKNVNCALETGTFMGNTSLILSDYFSKVYTVEKHLDINPYFARTPEEERKGHRSLRPFIEEQFKDKQNIYFKEGDSLPFIKHTFESNPDERFFILLDSHEDSFTTILLELDFIKKYSNRSDHVIIIDDGKFFHNHGTSTGKGMHGPHPSYDNIGFISKELLYEHIFQISSNYIILDTGLPEHVDFSGSEMIIAYTTER